jgi:IclR family transcriptional regulator, acetate operon repressor
MRSNIEIKPRTAQAGRLAALQPVKQQERKLGVTARSFAILDHVAASQHPVDVLDIIASLKLPKATAYRLVDWFVSHGYLGREPGRKRLIVGPRLTKLAFGVLSASMRNDAPHLVLQQLVRSLNETCNIGTLLNGEVIYLDRVEAEHWPLRLHYTSGSRVPLHCSAIGKLFLALASTSRRQRLLESLDLRGYTEGTITDKAKLAAELRQIRKEQVSFDREEYLAGVVCAAVPVLGKNGELLAALAIQAPAARMNVQAVRNHLPVLRRASAELADIFQENR